MYVLVRPCPIVGFSSAYSHEEDLPCHRVREPSILPFQVLVFARLPVLQSNTSMTQLTTVGILFAYTLVLFVWLHMGQFSQRLWLPYSNLLLSSL